MIPGVNKNNENSQRSEPNGAGGSGKHSESPLPLVEILGAEPPKKIFRS